MAMCDPCGALMNAAQGVEPHETLEEKRHRTYKRSEKHFGTTIEYHCKTCGTKWALIRDTQDGQAGWKVM